MIITRKPDGQLRYKYKATLDLTFCFSMLCEVGEPWQNDAKVELEKLEAKGYKIIYGQELESNKSPYYSDFAIKVK